MAEGIKLTDSEYVSIARQRFRDSGQRGRYLSKNPKCKYHGEDCQGSLVIDHIIPLKFNGEVADPKNLQVLCTMHHRKKSERDRLKYSNETKSIENTLRYLNEEREYTGSKYCSKSCENKYHRYKRKVKKYIGYDYDNFRPQCEWIYCEHNKQRWSYPNTWRSFKKS